MRLLKQQIHKKKQGSEKMFIIYFNFFFKLTNIEINNENNTMRRLLIIDLTLIKEIERNC